MIPNKFHMCKEEEKTIDHILVHYSKATILCQLILTLFEIE